MLLNRLSASPKYLCIATWRCDGWWQSIWPGITHKQFSVPSTSKVYLNTTLKLTPTLFKSDYGLISKTIWITSRSIVLLIVQISLLTNFSDVCAWFDISISHTNSVIICKKIRKTKSPIRKVYTKNIYFICYKGIAKGKLNIYFYSSASTETNDTIYIISFSLYKPIPKCFLYKTYVVCFLLLRYYKNILFEMIIDKKIKKYTPWN